jgi:4-amino-4-deoxy-L-arabinose transferase-like glycosyltransferase
LAILGLGLVVRLAVLPATTSLGPRIADERQYHELARNLADGRGFAFEAGPTSLRPPLYPAFVAAVWTVTGSRSLQWVRVGQIGLALATTVVVFLLGRELFGDRTGLVAAAIACFYPSLLVSNPPLIQSDDHVPPVTHAFPLASSAMLRACSSLLPPR